MPDLSCWGGDIVPKNKEGNPSHAFLKCSCGKRGWHTKNIGYIGARTIYTFKGGCQWLRDHITCEPECSCSGKELSVDEEIMGHIRDCPECHAYCYR